MGRTTTRQFLFRWSSVGMVLLGLGPISAFAQTRAWFPHAADPDYGRTYQSYREQMATRPIISPALGYDGPSSKGEIHLTQTTKNSSAQGGLGGVFSSFGQSIKQGWTKVSQSFTPQEKVEKPTEPTSVFSQARPSADTYAAMARFCAENSRLAEAEQHYQNALRANPRHLGALLGYAKLKEIQGHPAEAIQIYQRALSFYPQEASVLNNAGLCYARNGQLETAAALLHRAVQLQPKKPLYRNNLAMVLVEMGRADTALAHLRAVYPEAVARYNLGQLLLHKGQWETAAEQFAAALEADPSMQAAKAWLEELARRKAGAPLSGGTEVAHLPRRPTPPRTENSWSEVSDLPPSGPASPPSVPSPLGRPSDSRGYPGQQAPSEPPSIRLEQPRLYGAPGGTFSSDPEAARQSPGEEELAPLPPVDPPGR
ncbi:MAG TPA: tetratricopeptide repeat protein [Thermoguttaceae bacterium]|nr:tetratricopeptide repeat protein [Thermoguttaceae bacterium]HPP52546.1 tetratricopeptide repeat protein [Thermoguttaceae bacterium]